ncbi:glycosyltransferase family 2 protein [Pontibacter arcticus]|uniref:Family 2 glycosyl transferase n=1 Tax=Pontibacter arcticus TaxID=2080288 RepID=A0A364RDL7_9BACT|nr:glycosyltransferase [Pontibacter arcticus]RAU82364.1 family 2 glycosyl transferase [Pontibacter arcticus]
MTRIPASPPAILPLPSDRERPLWSVMIPVYNCSIFLPQTLNCLLRQQISEDMMQIEVVDDASTDTDVEALVNEIGKGRIKYYRQPQNVGSLRNFETCINRAQGQLVHLLHGDDKVREGFYAKITSLFEQYPEAGAAFCRYSCVDENGARIYDQGRIIQKDGILENWLVQIAERQRTQYVAKVVRREVYEKLGSFYGLTYGEDWEMWVRIAKHYPVAYTPEILADYRKHTNSITENKYLTGQNLEDISNVINLIQTYLPLNQRQEVLRRSKSYYAAYGLKTASQLWSRSKNKQAVYAQVKQALRLYKTPLLFWKTAKIYFKVTFNKV